jgi:hypothetical protein
MGKQLVWVAVIALVLLVVGGVVLKVAAALLKLVFFVLIGVALVGGGLHLAGKARAALRGGRSREIR